MPDMIWWLKRMTRCSNPINYQRTSIRNIIQAFTSLQHRRLSYSRHAVDDRDLSTQVNLHELILKPFIGTSIIVLSFHVSLKIIGSWLKSSHKLAARVCLLNINNLFYLLFIVKVNYKMRMNIRRMAQGDRKHHKRSKRLNKVRT